METNTSDTINQIAASASNHIRHAFTVMDYVKRKRPNIFARGSYEYCITCI